MSPYVSRILVPVLVTLVVLGIAFTAFTGYVAYCGMHPFKLPEALEEPPRPDAARLGGVLEAGLNWALRVCGGALTILGAALAMRRTSLDNSLNSAVVILAGVALMSQHWAAGLALGVVAVAFVIGIGFGRPSGPDH